MSISIVYLKIEIRKEIPETNKRREEKTPQKTINTFVKDKALMNNKIEIKIAKDAVKQPKKYIKKTRILAIGFGIFIFP